MNLLDLVNILLNSETEEEQIKAAQDVSRKAENLVKYLKSVNAMAQAVEGEIRELQAKAKALRDRENRLKAWMLEALQSMNLDKIPAGIYTVKRALNPPSVEIVGDVPSQYMVEKITHSPDKKAIKSAIDHGEEITFARIVRGERLEIK